MSKKYTAHILSHTHWDREWYLNSPYTNEWLIPFFNNLFAMMEKEEKYKFILDGQLSMIDDYFEELDKSGYSVTQAKRKIRKYVERKSLFIGPYYLQPDWQLISEEALVRNMMIGRQMADELGGCIKSGWLLDNFGQISQTAQLHKSAGLEGLFVWRGVAMDPQNVTSEFLWESPDGSKILSIYLLNSYRNVMRLAEFDKIMKERMDCEVDKLIPFATTSHVLMMNGYDQEMIPDDIQPYVRSGQLNGENYETIQDDPDNYIRAIAREKPNLPTLKGSLYNGRFISVFPGVMSSRMYLKIQNDKNQNLLEKKAEPLSVLALFAGGDYGHSTLHEAWKLLLKNHPHDSICGVSIDDVHKDMEERGRQVHRLAQSHTEKQLAYLAGLIDTSQSDDDTPVIIFNTLTKRRSGVVRIEGESYFLRDIPSLGYRVMEKHNPFMSSLVIAEDSVENAFIKVDFNNNGSFNLLWKETGKIYKEQGVIEDRGDSGDEYNYSYPQNDRIITSQECNAKRELIIHNSCEAVYRISYEMLLPESDINNHNDRSDKTRILPVVTYVTVEVNSPIIKIRTSLRNTVRDHRMRVLFPTGIKAEKVYAGSPFDLVERPVHIKPYTEEEIPEHVRKVIVGAREASPSTDFHTRDILDINDGKQGLAVFNKGLPEYQIINDDTAALTLFRAVGWIAKEINTRIGDAGPEIYTPDAQCLRDMTFDYALCPHSGDVSSGVISWSQEYSNPLIPISTRRHGGDLPTENSWLSLTSPGGNIKMTGIKASEDGSAVILRGVNLSKESEEVVLNLTNIPQKVSRTNILEEEFLELDCQEGFVSFSVNPKEIFTLKLDYWKAVQNIKSPILLEEEDSFEDFSHYDYADYVTQADIDGEKNRAEYLKDKIEDPLWRRTALEAQLSHILSHRRWEEGEIRKLGYQLNEARVQRRIHDYLSANITLDKS